MSILKDLNFTDICPGQFTCGDQECVDLKYVCDGIDDCVDYSDEDQGCGKFVKNDEKCDRFHFNDNFGKFYCNEI